VFRVLVDRKLKFEAKEEKKEHKIHLIWNYASLYGSTAPERATTCGLGASELSVLHELLASTGLIRKVFKTFWSLWFPSLPVDLDPEQEPLLD
jgi:hypothetical protein